MNEENVETSYRVFYDGESAYFARKAPASAYFDCLVGQIDDLRLYIEVRDIDTDIVVRSKLLKKEQAYYG